MATQTDRPKKYSSLLWEAQRRFDKERDEKNRLYSFLMENGMMDRFLDFKRRRRKS